MFNLQEVLVANGTGALILGIVLYARRHNRIYEDLGERLFFYMVLCAFLSTVFELVAFFIDGMNGTLLYYLNWIFNMFNFITPILIGGLWILYSDFRIYKSIKHLQRFRITFIPLFISLILVMSNPVTKIIFTISKEGNAYSRGPLGGLSFIIIIFYLITSLFIVLKERSRSIMRDLFPIELFALLIIFGILCQTRLYGLAIGWLSMDVALMGVYIMLQTEITFIDPLTGIFNRKYLDHAIDRIIKSKVNYYGIMIDLDDFKHINDTYGHTVGDQALRDICQIFQEAIPLHCLVTRYAGDEFVVLVPVEYDVKTVIYWMLLATDEFNKAHKREYELAFSYGYSFLNENNASKEKFLSEMDGNMYMLKKERKQNQISSHDLSVSYK